MKHFLFLFGMFVLWMIPTYLSLSIAKDSCFQVGESLNTISKLDLIYGCKLQFHDKWLTLEQWYDRQ